MNPQNKQAKDLSDIELAVMIRDNMSERERIQNNLMILDQELRDRTDRQNNKKAAEDILNGVKSPKKV